MDFNFEAFLWYLLLADCAFANVVAWFNADWYGAKYPRIAFVFPASKPWCLLYLMLTIWLGMALRRLGVLPW
ncbi:MAG: hypothetical protein VXX29_06485 [Verrucomicrobiota bacterium]|nr:hypothetical protein [Verrucomicrobiota bacterium]